MIKEFSVGGLLLAVLCGCTFYAPPKQKSAPFFFNEKQTTINEASEIGYEAAKKWSPVAIIWYMNPGVGLVKDWQTSGASYTWGMLFADPSNGQIYHVDIKGDKVTYQGVDNILNVQTKYEGSFPIVSPKIELVQARQIAVDNGAPTDQNPSAIFYQVDHQERAFQGIPLWLVEFSSQNCYFINGLTGEFLGSRDMKTARLTLSGQKTPESKVQIEQQIIKDFFNDITNQDPVSAVFLLSDDIISSDSKKNNWVKELNKVTTAKVLFIKEFEPETWSADEHCYEVLVDFEIKDGQSSDLWSAGEQIKRLTVKSALDERWQISKIEN